jgi:hypothetical protein
MRKRVHHDWPWHTADRFEHRLRKVRTHVHPPVTNVELHVGLVACCVTKPAHGEPNEFAVEKARRIVPLDRARSFITLLMVLHHPFINYTCASVTPMRCAGFDLIVLFTDSFFMARCFLCQACSSRAA